MSHGTIEGVDSDIWCVLQIRQAAENEVMIGRWRNKW